MRITKWYADNPLFIAKQVGLQLSNVQLEHREDRITNKATTGQGFFNNAINFVSNTANKISNDIGPTRIYTPANTLAQVAAVATGQHFVRHGFTPIMDDKDKYDYIVQENNENGNNRLVRLANQFSNPDTALEPITEYKGGPGSIYGIGETVINRAKDVNSFTSFNNTPEKRTRLLRSFIPIPLQKLLSIDDDGNIDYETSRNSDDGSITISNDKFNLRKRDYREYKNSIRLPEQKELPFVKEGQDMETRIGIARSRTDAEYQSDYTIPVPGAAGKINALGLYYSDSPHEGTAYTDGNNFESLSPEKVRDLIKFRIKVIDNDHPGSGVYMVFRAF